MTQTIQQIKDDIATLEAMGDDGTCMCGDDEASSEHSLQYGTHSYCNAFAYYRKQLQDEFDNADWHEYQRRVRATRDVVEGR